MNKKLALIGIALCFWTVCGALGLFRPLLAEPMQVSAPKDSQLVADFRAHRAVFERLRQMVTEDMHTQSFWSKSELGGIEPEARRREYETLLGLNQDLRVTVNYDGSVRFIYVTGGVSAIGPGWLKGIQFVPSSAKVKGVLVKSLDDPRDLRAGVYFVQIEPEWFILYQLDG